MTAPRYEAVQERKREARGWGVWENDGSEDGRLVGGDMLEADAKLVADLLNRAADEEPARS